MFPTTRVVELSWLARCVVRPARPTAFNRRVCSPFLASVSLRAYRVFGNCPDTTGKEQPGSPGHEASARSPPSISSPSRAIPFRFCLFFFFPSLSTALTNCFRSQFNANRPWRRIKTSLKGLLQERLNLKHLEKRVGRRELCSVS